MGASCDRRGRQEEEQVGCKNQDFSPSAMKIYMPWAQWLFDKTDCEDYNITNKVFFNIIAKV